ncbi:hypothetical protein AX17_005866 [Amanita inopinata Kibby_2008]|nr:hypothetical protein AX17_005866 [Amanita inopinata Kibby_2008]
MGNKGEYYLERDPEHRSSRRSSEHQHYERHRHEDTGYHTSDCSRNHYYGKENGKDKDTGERHMHNGERKSKRFSGYMRAWGDEDDHHDKSKEQHQHYHRDVKINVDKYKGYQERSYSEGKYRDDVQGERRKEDDVKHSKHYHRRRQGNDYKRHGRDGDYSTSVSRHDELENEMVATHGQQHKQVTSSRHDLRGNEEPHSYRLHYKKHGERQDCPDREENGHRVGTQGRHRKNYHHQSPALRSYDEAEWEKGKDVERGRKHSRSKISQSDTEASSRDESDSSDGTEDSYHGRRSRSYSSDGGTSRSRSESRNRRDGHSSYKSSKRKHKYRSRSRSSSTSWSSSEKRERKRKKKDNTKKEKSKKKDKEERRSILTGKKIKLKVKKDKQDHERDANRLQLLQFLNSAYE